MRDVSGVRLFRHARGEWGEARRRSLHQPADRQVWRVVLGQCGGCDERAMGGGQIKGQLAARNSQHPRTLPRFAPPAICIVHVRKADLVSPSPSLLSTSRYSDRLL